MDPPHGRRFRLSIKGEEKILVEVLEVSIKNNVPNLLDSAKVELNLQTIP